MYGLNYSVSPVDVCNACVPVVRCAVFAREETVSEVRVGGCKYVPCVPQVLLIYNKCSRHVMKGENH
jgi:hypothetical protein